MKTEKDNSLISLSDYRKQKGQKRRATTSNETKPSSKESFPLQENKIFYMSNYLKTKEIPDLKDLHQQKNQNRKFSPKTKQGEKNNLIILDQYRKEKHNKKIWKKQFQFYTKEALSVSGLAFLFLFTFNLAVSIQSHSPSGNFKTANPSVARAETLKEKPSFKTSRGVANVKENKKPPLSHKKWTQKIKHIDRKDVILGKKASSSDYTGF